jgi:hypothetical protein
LDREVEYSVVRDVVLVYHDDPPFLRLRYGTSDIRNASFLGASGGRLLRGAVAIPFMTIPSLCVGKTSFRDSGEYRSYHTIHTP